MNSIFHKGFTHCELIKLHRRALPSGARREEAIEHEEAELKIDPSLERHKSFGVDSISAPMGPCVQEEDVW
jgi:hypothetical protein